MTINVRACYIHLIHYSRSCDKILRLVPTKVEENERGSFYGAADQWIDFGEFIEKYKNDH